MSNAKGIVVLAWIIGLAFILPQLKGVTANCGTLSLCVIGALAGFVFATGAGIVAPILQVIRQNGNLTVMGSDLLRFASFIGAIFFTGLTLAVAVDLSHALSFATNSALLTAAAFLFLTKFVAVKLLG